MRVLLFKKFEVMKRNRLLCSYLFKGKIITRRNFFNWPQTVIWSRNLSYFALLLQTLNERKTVSAFELSKPCTLVAPPQCQRVIYVTLRKMQIFFRFTVQLPFLAGMDKSRTMVFQIAYFLAWYKRTFCHFCEKKQ